jgi:helicase
MLALLEGWEFIRIPQKGDFVSAAELNDEKNARIVSTLLGKKVAELYIDPLTAHHFVVCLGKRREGLMPFSFLQMISYTLEMRPLLSVKTREWEELQERMAKHCEELLVSEPSLYDEEYDEFLNSVKTGRRFAES